MKVSVAMATYNGECFISEQLLSILNQSRNPDEVIICDDGSTDNTVKIINDFITEHYLFNSWKIICNKSNKGYSLNFLDCAEMTTGDVIFFCDQDDIWHKDKIFKMTIEFEKNTNILALSCSYKYIDSNGTPIFSLYNKISQGFGVIHKISFTAQIRKYNTCGMILAIKRQVLKQLRPIVVNYNTSFDLPIGGITAVKGSYYRISEPLAYRRVHIHNVSEPKLTLKSRINNIEYHIKGRKGRLELMQIYYKILYNEMSIKDSKNLKNAIELTKRSIINLERRRLIPLFFDFFKYNPMYSKLIALTNIICVFFGDYTKLKN